MYCWHGLVVNTLCLINVVALHQARLLPGWVTAFGQVNMLVYNHPGQLSLLSLQGREIEYQPAWLGLRWGVFTMCDLMWQATVCSFETGFHTVICNQLYCIKTAFNCQSGRTVTVCSAFINCDSSRSATDSKIDSVTLRSKQRNQNQSKLIHNFWTQSHNPEFSSP